MVALEDQYRAYQDAITSAVRILRPYDEVASVDLGSLDSELARLEPLLVICSLSGSANADRGFAWIELPEDPYLPTKVRIGEHRYELTNPTLEELIRVIEKTEELAPKDPEAG